jgi:hypothetical protein
MTLHKMTKKRKEEEKEGEADEAAVEEEEQEEVTTHEHGGQRQTAWRGPKCPPRTGTACGDISCTGTLTSKSSSKKAGESRAAECSGATVKLTD